MFGDNRVCVFSALTSVGSFFYLQGGLYVVESIANLYRCRPYTAFNRARRGKGDYISDVLSILGYTVFIFVVIIFCAIFKL